MANNEVLKYEGQFKSYLTKSIDNQRVVSDCISRCRRVQKHEGDLHEHFINDRGKSLIEKLHYTMEEAHQEIKPRHSIEFRGRKGFKSVYEGTQSLNTAVKHYFEYMRKHGS
jgi:hypothetical protein